MKILKKMLSVFLTAAIMVSMICVGTVSAGAVTTTTNNGKTVCVKHSLKNVDWSDIFIFAIEFVCSEKNFVITSLNLSKDNTIYWNTMTAAGKDNGELTGWLDFNTVSVRKMTSSVNPIDFLNSSAGLEAEYTIEDEDIAKLLKTCTEMRVFYFSSSEAKWYVEKTTLTDYSQLSASSSKSISSLKISDLKNYTYTGKNRKASVTIKDGDYTLKKGTDYTLTYKNCKNIGTASVTIKGKGNYTGTKTLTYKIVPKKTTLKATKKSDTKVKFSWAAVDGAEKYQIYYSTNGGKYKKLATVSGSKTSVTISELDFEKNDYKFKIRSYGTDDGKKYYSSFSKAVTVK